MSGKSDPAKRRKAQRSSRERGCWVYVPGEMLEAGGLALDGPAPLYRIWGGRRGRVVVTLYPCP